jgi:hypothetical protein
MAAVNVVKGATWRGLPRICALTRPMLNRGVTGLIAADVAS